MLNFHYILFNHQKEDDLEKLNLNFYLLFLLLFFHSFRGEQAFKVFNIICYFIIKVEQVKAITFFDFTN